MLEPELVGLLRRHAARHSVPGAALGVMTGSTITTATHGVGDLSIDEPVTDRTPFAVGSLTKPIVATLLVDLASEGAANLDAPISEQLPELTRSRWASTATPRHLLSGLSRIPLRYDWEFSLTQDSDTALSEITAMVADAEPAGPHWSYSNLAFTVLGRLIEHVTGALWEEATRERLLEPLGMSSTACLRTGSGAAVASGHEIGNDGISIVEPWVCRAYCSSGTSVYSSVRDLLTFARRHLDDRSLQGLRTVRSEVSIHGWLDGWGMGWAFFDWNRTPVWGWDGVVPGQRAFLRLSPQHDAAIALVTNGSTGRAMYRSLVPEIAAHWFGVTIPELQLDADDAEPGLDLSSYAGTYAWPDRQLEMSVEDDALVVESGDQRAIATPIDHRVFLLNRSNPDTPTMTFDDFDDEGRPGVVYRMLWGLPRI